MKLVNLIEYLSNAEKLEQFYTEQGIDPESDGLCIYMQDALDIESEIKVFGEEKTAGKIEYEENGIKYIYLLEINLSIDLIEDEELKKGSDMGIAQRILDYGINDA